MFRVLAVGLALGAASWLPSVKPAASGAARPSSSLTAEDAQETAHFVAALLSARHSERKFYVSHSTGESMLPAIGSDSWQVMEVIEFDEISAGDILDRRDPSGQITEHRAKEKNGRGNWILKGDNNRGPDAIELTRKNLVGRAVVVINARRPRPKSP